MAKGSILWIAAPVLTLLATIPGTLAQSRGHEDVTAASAVDDSTSGIRTDRLTPKQLQTWKAVERIAQAEDPAGQPLHPKLHGLWQWARVSGHPIFIEMLERKDPFISHAGNLTLEEMDSNGHPQVAVIRLFLWVIDEASVQKEVRRSDGFIPFERLGKNERYAQVVGHELAHAVLMLEDPAYARLCAEQDRQRAEFILSRSQSRSESAYNEETKQQLMRLQSLTDEIEKPAKATEVEIWRELLEGQWARARAGRASK